MRTPDYNQPDSVDCLCNNMVACLHGVRRSWITPIRARAQTKTFHRDVIVWYYALNEKDINCLIGLFENRIRQTCLLSIGDLLNKIWHLKLPTLSITIMCVMTLARVIACISLCVRFILLNLQPVYGLTYVKDTGAQSYTFKLPFVMRSRAIFSPYLYSFHASVFEIYTTLQYARYPWHG